MRRSFTEGARRAQIVQAAIETIAEAGYRGATFARITERAGLSSTGLISYHFASRDELIGEVVAKVIGDIGAFMARRMAGAGRPGRGAARLHRGQRRVHRGAPGRHEGTAGDLPERRAALRRRR